MMTTHSNGDTPTVNDFHPLLQSDTTLNDVQPVQFYITLKDFQPFLMSHITLSGVKPLVQSTHYSS